MEGWKIVVIELSAGKEYKCNISVDLSQVTTMAGLDVCLELVHEVFGVIYIMMPTGMLVYSHGKGLRMSC